MLVWSCTDTSAPLRAPDKITSVTLTYSAASDDVVLAWKAPGDGRGAAVVRYEIRFSYSAPIDWDLALAVDDPPDPLPPGQAQQYTLALPERGRDLYAAIRSFDGDGNVSPTSELASTHIDGYQLSGRAVDGFTGLPLEGLAVTVTGRAVHTTSTDAQGGFGQSDLPRGVINVSLRSGTAVRDYHTIDCPIELDGDTSIDLVMIPYQAAEFSVFNTVLDVFLAASGTGTGNRILKKWSRFPIEVYTPPFVTDGGLDYAAFARQAGDSWNSHAGTEVFTWVESPPDTGVVLFYKTPAEMGIHVGITRHTNDPNGFPVLSEISVVNTFANEMFLYQTMLHELGHTIRFVHMPTSSFIMFVGQPLPPDVTNDEALAALLTTRLPVGINMTVYDTNAP